MVTETQRDVTLNVEFFAPGRAADTWRNRDDGTHFAVGLVSPAGSSDDALQQFAATWESEYGRQYVRALVTVKSACPACYGAGRIRSKRSQYKTIACRTCRGIDSETEVVKGLVFSR